MVSLFFKCIVIYFFTAVSELATEAPTGMLSTLCGSVTDK